MMIRAEKPEWSENYTCHMMEENAIPGLLAFQTRHTGQGVDFYYEITSRQPLNRIFERKKPDGAGQHGEGGGTRVPMMSAKDTVATVAKPITEHLGLKSGDKAFVMINGCGATTMMEMLILYKETVAYLENMGVKVVANMVGEVLTVQEAGGFQMNIAKWDDEIEALWNAPAHACNFFKE